MAEGLALRNAQVKDGWWFVRLLFIVNLWDWQQERPPQGD
jgi:hypothetical protein